MNSARWLGHRRQADDGHVPVGDDVAVAGAGVLARGEAVRDGVVGTEPNRGFVTGDGENTVESENVLRGEEGTGGRGDAPAPAAAPDCVTQCSVLTRV